MKICPFSIEREEILARAIGPLAAELRLIDAADFISMLRFEHHGSIADLVESAAELYFHPGTIRFGAGGDYALDWDSLPSVTLDLEIMPRGVTIYARLMLGRDKAAISIDYINFQSASSDPDVNTAFLASSLGEARLMAARSAGAGAA
ncbi:hypothetical protein J5N58_21525 [Rhizobium cremeum]|uniref:hypothetical protein n=1 Tax=Rhizobium cremeum TaxID=2813827 RepID=UPI000DD9E7E8|nr:hypothetical protein [Rhizobium cremeum]MCJ7997050.1 hypothetical protein [Rhizobium cremeum]MCJ8002268.1 hypothetical protein [Rhizobium cremeum]